MMICNHLQLDIYSHVNTHTITQAHMHIHIDHTDTQSHTHTRKIIHIHPADTEMRTQTPHPDPPPDCFRHSLEENSPRALPLKSKWLNLFTSDTHSAPQSAMAFGSLRRCHM